jgi:GH24 family phage-related lysozyme (muramidase)
MTIKVENMAIEVAKKGDILPHQRKAFQVIDGLLTEEQRIKIAEVWRQPQVIPPSETLLRFIPTDKWDVTRRGGRLRQWLLQLMNNGRVVDQIVAWSGAPGAQEFIDPRHDYPGSLRPLPPGRYRVGLVEVAASGSFGEGLGRIWIGLHPLNPPNARSNFGIHLDANMGTSPGSAGCIVTKNEQDLQRVVGWLKQRNRPEFLDCVHILGGNPGAQTVPKSGLDLIKQFEGCHLKAYPDPLSGGDPWTIGWGTTRYPDGKKVRPGDVISQAKADEYLIEYCQRIVEHLSKTIPGWDELSENRRGALLSFAYNLGMGFYGAPGFATITARLRNREYDKVPEALLLYRNPGTNVETGLLRRRRAEGELWMQT